MSVSTGQQIKKFEIGKGDKEILTNYRRFAIKRIMVQNLDVGTGKNMV
jgi:hypothetical protein